MRIQNYIVVNLPRDLLRKIESQTITEISSLLSKAIYDEKIAICKRLDKAPDIIITQDISDFLTHGEEKNPQEDFYKLLEEN